jgi:hypothetical protein
MSRTLEENLSHAERTMSFRNAIHGLVTIARVKWFSTCSGPQTARCHRFRYLTTGNSRQFVV